MKDLEPSVLPPSSEASATEITRAQFFNLFAAVFLPMFLAAMDQTLLATATPAIAGALGGLTDTSWIAVAYLLASAAVIPLYGRLGDRLGRRNVLLLAVGIFSLGSLACGVAQSLPQLIVARVVQGLGGGGLIMLSQALIGELIVPRERVKFQGYFAMMFTSASIAGPVLGGTVVSYFSWRWLFLVNLPLTAFAVWRLCKLPLGERYPDQSGTHDLAGIALFAVGTSAAVYWLTSVGHHFSWHSRISGGLLVLAACTLSALLWHEKRHPSPLLPLDLLEKKEITYSLLTTLMFAACMFSVVFFLPIYLQLGHRMSAMHSGLLLLPVTAGMVVGALIAGRIVARTGEPKQVPVVGMVLSSVALVLLGALPANATLVGILGFMAGAGFGTVMPTNQVVLQTVAGRARLGAVTAMTSLFRSIGSALGAALFGALVFALMPDIDLDTIARAVDAGQSSAVTHAFHMAFLLTAAIAAAAAYTASRVPHVVLWSPATGRSDARP